MAALEPGDPRSVGEYQLLRRLGAGGMGRVYLGRSPGGRAVAVKVVHAELVAGQPEFRSRFRREVEAARKVSGAFTAPVVDADPDAPLPWLVTSYIAGPSLQEAVAERGPLPAASVLALAAGLAEALTSIHAAQLVHRDLKPSNVLLAEDGPRVIDFGIARSVESVTITRAGLMVGSPGFMSPEQVAGGEVTGASDVFALGAVLTYAATGGNPFGDGPTPALLYRVVHDEPDIGAVTDPALAALIADCLAKDPAHRPTPREILTRIAPAADTTALLARPAADPRTDLDLDPDLANRAPAPAATRPVTRHGRPRRFRRAACTAVRCSSPGEPSRSPRSGPYRSRTSSTGAAARSPCGAPPVPSPCRRRSPRGRWTRPPGRSPPTTPAATTAPRPRSAGAGARTGPPCSTAAPARS
ncbi:serine/threonine-protein kinase [Streptomyces sp. NPDC058457]|uniref:serine/threonine-protein kinase n=1 Tax=Streptomyces sp. NPDC058457 TaxID=3346507 RepID=UPI00364D7A93